MTSTFPASPEIIHVMQPARSKHRYTYAEYLTYERDSALKHDYEDGEIYAMAGGSRRHNALALNIGAALRLTRKTGRVAFQSDQRIRILATGKATYPDASMVCGPIEGDPADPDNSTITNPTLIVEVLSPSTEQEDRGSKWLHYQRIPSLQEYILVSQAEPRIERYTRLPSDGWQYTEETGGSVQLSAGATINVDEIYRDLPD